MIEYIINHMDGSTLFYTDSIVQTKHTAFYQIKKLCEQSLFSYDGYIKSVKKLLNEHYQIPVFINESHGFMPTKRVRDYENTWINLFAIHHIEEENNGVSIEFISGRRLYINYSMKRMKKRIEVLMKIKSLKVNIFIFNHIEMYEK